LTLEASILGLSVWGPGLEGWAASRPVLAGALPYAPRPSPAPPPTILPATERRRTGPVVRLALAVAHEAATASGLPPGSLRAVFGSSNGDGLVVGGILDALATAGDERVVSPTQFHNSVHNAAAGYWSIATASREPATCLGCHDSTWAASLLTAMADLAAGRRPLLLCCYDHPLPAPLAALRRTEAAFAVALVLALPAPGTPRIAVAYRSSPARDPDLHDPALEALARGNPAAQSLPLLIALARATAGRLAVPYLDGRLDIDVQP